MEKTINDSMVMVNDEVFFSLDPRIIIKKKQNGSQNAKSFLVQ